MPARVKRGDSRACFFFCATAAFCAAVVGLCTFMLSTQWTIPQSQLVPGRSRWNLACGERIMVDPDVAPRTPPRNCAYWGVVTTIFSATPAVGSFLKHWPGACLVIVGDCKTNPLDWRAMELSNPDRVVYLSPSEQLILPFRMTSKVPWNHFGRKSIGYLFAIRAQAKAILDFDDDNHLLEVNTDIHPTLASLVENPEKIKVEIVSTTQHVYNPYPDFIPAASLDEGSEPRFIWPRGFPLSFIKDPKTLGPAQREFTAVPGDGKRLAVLQSLAQHDPDVDAIYRLSRPLPVYFLEKSAIVRAAQPRTFAPFNAQATVFFPSAFWALLLPTSVAGRVSDIWRSYIATRLLWETNHLVGFVSPFFEQRRNPHSYMADYREERPLYDSTDMLLETLSKWPGIQEGQSTDSAYLSLMDTLSNPDVGLLGSEDAVLAALWREDLASAGYRWPQPQSAMHIAPFVPEQPNQVDGRGAVFGHISLNPGETTTASRPPACPSCTVAFAATTKCPPAPVCQCPSCPSQVTSAPVPVASTPSTRPCPTMGIETDALAKVTGDVLLARAEHMDQIMDGTNPLLTARPEVTLKDGSNISLEVATIAVVVCWAGRMSYSLYENSHGWDRGVRPAMTACAQLLPKYGFVTHVYFDLPNKPDAWSLPTHMKPACEHCTFILKYQKLKQMISREQVDYLVVEAWTPNMPQTIYKFVDDPKEVMVKLADASKKLRFLFMFDGTDGDKKTCRENPGQPILAFFKKYQKKIAAVTFYQALAATRFARLEFGIHTAIIPYPGETRFPRTAATGASGGVLLIGPLPSIERASELCAAARLTEKPWFSTTADSLEVCAIDIEHIGFVNADDEKILWTITVGVLPSSCPASRGAAGVGQSKLVTLLQMGLRVVVEDSEPYSSLVWRFGAGTVIPSGSPAVTVAAAVQVELAAASLEDKNRIRLLAGQLFHVEETAFRLGNILTADRWERPSWQSS